MTTIWLASDHHFGHANILNFKRDDGTLLRTKPSGQPFADVEEMNWFMIDAHNRVVKPQDHVYLLGDFAMKSKDIDWAAQLNGHLRLVRGNHDIFRTVKYLEYFDEIYGVRVLDDMILSHIPIHPECLKDRWHGNIHGHTHANRPVGHFGPRYYNVSVEMIDYTPITLEEAKCRLQEQQANGRYI